MTYKELQIMAPPQPPPQLHLLPKFVEIFQQMKMAQLFRSTIEQINSSLGDCSDELRRKLQEYKACLKNMALCVRYWIREIGDFLSYADDSIEVIGGPNNDYVAQFHRYLYRIYELYKNVEESMKKANKALQSATVFCEEKGREAKTKKNTTRAIGGTVAASAIVTGIGGGVGASIVAGLFTFGIGTAVGLGITAVAAGGAIAGGAVTAGAAGVTTHLLATKFKSFEDTCKEHCIKFDALSKPASEMRLTLLELLEEVKYIENKMEDANSCDHKQLYTPLIQGVKECHTTFKDRRKELDGLLEKISKS